VTMLEARKGWVLEAAMIARIVLASTLLLSACTLIFGNGARMKLVSLVELFFGAIIAVGWETRYAAGLVLLGTLATSLWAIQLSTVFAGSQPAVQTLILSSVFLTCFGRNNAFKDRFSITEKGRLPNSDPGAISTILSHPDTEVSVRLEPGFPRNLHKQTCTVTFHDGSGGVRKTEKEVGHAKHDH
jgi:hypothetical protein